MSNKSPVLTTALNGAGLKIDEIKKTMHTKGSDKSTWQTANLYE